MADDVLSEAGVNFIQECRDDLEHDPRCSLFLENRKKPRECDCELGLWDDLLASHRALQAENERLRELAEAQDDLLIEYRLGRQGRGAGKAIDRLTHARQALAQTSRPSPTCRENLQAITRIGQEIEGKP